MAAAPRKSPGPSRQGLAEYVLVVGFLVLAAAGAVALFGDEIRSAFGVRPAATSRSTTPTAAP